MFQNNEQLVTGAADRTVIPLAQAIGNILRVSSATIPTQFFKIALPFASSTMLARLGPEQRNAATLINAFIDITYFVFNSPLSLTQSLVIKYSAEQPEKVGPIAQGAWVFAILGSIPQLAILGFSEPILKACGQSPVVIENVKAFFNFYMIGVPFLNMQLVSEQVGLGTKKIYLAPITQAASLVAFVLMAYPLAFGSWDSPKLGLTGVVDGFLVRAAIMTLVSFGTFAVLSRRGEIFAPYELFRYGGSERSQAIKDTVKNLFNSGIGLFFLTASEIGILYAATLLIGKSDRNNLSAQLVVGQWTDILLIFSSALGTATQNLISDNMANKKQNIRRYIGLGQASSCVVPLMYTAVVLFNPEILMRPFVNSDNHNLENTLINQKLLLVSALNNWLIGIKYINIQAFVGMGKIRDPLVILSMLTTWISIPIGYALDEHTDWNTTVCYNAGLSIGFIISTLLLTIILFAKVNELTNERTRQLSQNILAQAQANNSGLSRFCFWRSADLNHEAQRIVSEGDSSINYSSVI